LIVFAETGLLVGFFLPGDSLLIAAGLFAARGDMNIGFLLLFISLAAIVGDATGFYIGKKLGQRLYAKKDSFFFRRKHLLEAQEFYERHGGKTIVIARFIPIVRTFAPTLAGAARMNYLRFAIYNVTGALLWVFGMLLSGYYLGRIFGDKINNYIHILILGVIFVSVMPLVIKWMRNKFGKKSNV
jgi:membrane-associated protein